MQVNINSYHLIIIATQMPIGKGMYATLKFLY